MTRKTLCFALLLMLLVTPLVQAAPPFVLGANPKYLALTPVIRIVDGFRLMNPDILSLAFADKVLVGEGSDQKNWQTKTHDQFMREIRNYIYMKGQRVEKVLYRVVEIDEWDWDEYQAGILIVFELTITAHNPYRKTFNRYYIVSKPDYENYGEWKAHAFILETSMVIED
jgi:hypothetical protein